MRRNATGTRTGCSLLAGWLALAGTAALAAAPGAPAGDSGTDRFLAGAQVELDEPVTGDALLAGGRVDSDASIGGDATVAGGQVAIRATVGEDLYAAGGSVEVDALVGGATRLAGGSVTIAPESQLEGGVAIAGGTVAAHGHYGGYLTIAGGEVTLGGDVAGDVRVYARRLVVAPGTHIGGALVYRTAEPVTLPPDVTVGGGVVREEAPADSAAPAWSGADAAEGIGWIGLLGLVVVGALLAFALPDLSRRATAALGTRPWRGLAIGFVALVCIPALAVVLFVSLVGIPLALIVLLLYAAMLIVAYVVGALYLGDRALVAARSGRAPTAVQRLFALFLVLLVLAFAGDVPVFGGLARFAVLLLGLGGIVLARRVPGPVAGSAG